MNNQQTNNQQKIFYEVLEESAGSKVGQSFIEDVYTSVKNKKNLISLEPEEMSFLILYLEDIFYKTSKGIWNINVYKADRHININTVGAALFFHRFVMLELSDDEKDYFNKIVKDIDKSIINVDKDILKKNKNNN